MRPPLTVLSIAKATLVSLALLCAPHALAQSPIITEFMASNSNTLLDEDGDSSDWIEIHNPGPTAVNLLNWSLTDDPENLRKWEFPAISLAPGDYLLVFASGKNRDTAGNELHASFKLDATGEYMALVEPDGVTIASEFPPAPQVVDVSYGLDPGLRLTTILPDAATGALLIPGDSSLGTNWVFPTFNDSGWLQVTSAVGYSEASLDSIPPSGALIRSDVRDLMLGINASAYIRFPFIVANPLILTRWQLSMRYNDGCVAWLNGEEIIRRNTPTNLTWNATAPASLAAVETFELFNLSAFEEHLTPGQNLLAIQGLNVSTNDATFLIQPIIEAASPTDTTNAVVYFTRPTPGAENVIGTAVLGPIIGNIAHHPTAPLDADDLVVTATVTGAFAPVAGATLHYRVMYGAEVAAQMFDDGAHGDGAAGDNLFGAIIPANVSAPGDMIRYRITAEDSSGRISRVPIPVTAPGTAAEHFGTVVRDPTVSSALPIFQWFVQSPSAADTGAGTRASVYYLDQFYDNVFVRIRGGTARGWPKKAYKFEFNDRDHLRFRNDVPRVDEFNLNTTYTDKSYVRAIITSEHQLAAGQPSPETFALHVRQNGVFFSVALFTEQLDRDFLRRHGLDPDGAFYKGSPGSTYDSVGSFEKKTRREETTEDLAEFLGNLGSSGTALTRFVFDEVDIPAQINYMATVVTTQNIDGSDKNHYLYRDTLGSREWHMLPWDLDLTFGPNALNTDTMVASQDFASHPFIGVRPWLLHSGKYNRFLEVIVGTPQTKEMLLRRIRTLVDDFLLTDYFENRIDELVLQLADDVPLDKARWGGNADFGGIVYTLQNATERIKREYLTPRRAYLTQAHAQGMPGAVGIPGKQPSNAFIQFGALDFNPSSGNQNEEYVQLMNTNSFAVDISGWELRNAVRHTFFPGTVIPAGDVLYVSPNSAAFRARSSGPTGNQGLFVQGNYKGQLAARGETVQLSDRDGIEVASLTYPGAPSSAQQFLRVTEIMYHPAFSVGDTNGSLEFVELKNIGSVPLAMEGIHFADGIQFSFSNTPPNLDPGQRVVLVKDNAAFSARYGPGPTVAGQYQGSLENRGERLRLLDANDEEILDFEYDNAWYPITDGLGFSLVIINENATPESWNDPADWRPNGQLDGTPAAADPLLPVFASVVVNEALTRTDIPPASDTIELHNLSSVEADLSGWFLSDDFNTPRKFRIPQGTTIAAGGYLLFDESDFNAIAGTSFALSSVADEVYLFSGDANTNLTGYLHGFSFGGADDGVSFGRHVTSVGEEHFVAQGARSLGSANTGPRVGPIIISEILYHPAEVEGASNTESEFIEISNVSASPVGLFDPAAPANTWKIAGGVDFVFPSGTSLAPGERLLLVNFDPVGSLAELTTFRTAYSVSPNDRVVGPYRGGLANGGDTVELVKPTTAILDVVPEVVVDRVRYGDALPWPPGADGFGLSLQRITTTQYGDDPAHWTAAPPTAGRDLSSGVSPTITMQPQSRTAATFSDVVLSIIASGTGPLRFQWRRNGINLRGADSATLSLNVVQPAQSGDYDVMVFNDAGSSVSSPARLTLVRSPAILTQPVHVTLFGSDNPANYGETGENAVFMVEAYSSSPLQFQWRRGSMDIAGATGPSLIVTGVTLADEDSYAVVVTDSVGSTRSTPANLRVLLRPRFTISPQSQTVAAGSSVTFSVQMLGTLPMGLRWRRGGQTLGFQVSNQRTAFFTIANVQSTHAGRYTVIATNEAFFIPGVLSAGADLTVIDDRDGDGLPDDYEIANGLNPDDPSDALLDADGDSMNAMEEYLAGTDPLDDTSFLKVNAIESDGQAIIEFTAVSNRTYTVEYIVGLANTGPWFKLADVVAHSTNRVERVFDLNPDTERYYRLATPARP